MPPDAPGGRCGRRGGRLPHRRTRSGWLGRAGHRRPQDLRYDGHPERRAVGRGTPPARRWPRRPPPTGSLPATLSKAAAALPRQRPRWSGVLGALGPGRRWRSTTGFHRRGFWDVVDRCGVTVLNAVPAILAILAEEPHRPRPPQPGSVLPAPPRRRCRPLHCAGSRSAAASGVLRDLRYDRGVRADLCQPAGARRPDRPDPSASCGPRPAIVWMTKGTAVAAGAAGLVEIVGPARRGALPSSRAPRPRPPPAASAEGGCAPATPAASTTQASSTSLAGSTG